MKISKELQKEYNQIYRFFKITTEDYDRLDWDGEVLDVWHNEKKVESYTYKNLLELGVIIKK